MALRRLLLLSFFFGASLLLHAQPSQPQDPNGDPDVVPISGIEYLLLGGAAYGVSQALRRKRKT